MTYTISPVSEAVVVSNPDPADGQLGVAPDAVLNWSVSDAGVTDFDVYFGTSPGFLGLVESITDGSTTYDPYGAGDMDWADWYYWRIDTPTTTGTVWSFAMQVPGDMDIDETGTVDLEDFVWISEYWTVDTTP